MVTISSIFLITVIIDSYHSYIISSFELSRGLLPIRSFRGTRLLSLALIAPGDQDGCKEYWACRGSWASLMWSFQGFSSFRSVPSRVIRCFMESRTLLLLPRWSNLKEDLLRPLLWHGSRSQVLSFALHTSFEALPVASFSPPRQSRTLSFWQDHQAIFRKLDPWNSYHFQDQCTSPAVCKLRDTDLPQNGNSFWASHALTHDWSALSYDVALEAPSFSLTILQQSYCHTSRLSFGNSHDFSRSVESISGD